MANFGTMGFPCNDPRPNGKPRQGSIYAAVNALTDADGVALSYLNSGQLVIKRLVAGKNITLADNGQQVSIASTVAAATMLINGNTVTPKSLDFPGATVATDAEGNVTVTVPTPEIPETGIDVTDGNNSLVDATSLSFGAGFRVIPNADGTAGKAGVEIDTANMPSNLSAFDRAGQVETGISKLTFLGDSVTVSRIASGQVSVTIAPPTLPDFSVANSSGIVTAAAKGLKFDGDGVTVTDEAGIPKVSISGQAKYGVPISKGGSEITDKPTSLNFTGAGVSVTTDPASGATTVDIPGSTGGGGNPVSVSKQGTEIVPAISGVNFVGPSVTVSAAGTVATVKIEGPIKKKFSVWFPKDTEPNPELPSRFEDLPEGWSVAPTENMPSLLVVTHNMGTFPVNAITLGVNVEAQEATVRQFSAASPLKIPVAADGTISTTQFSVDVSTYSTNANYGDCAWVYVEF